MGNENNLAPLSSLPLALNYAKPIQHYYLSHMNTNNHRISWIENNIHQSAWWCIENPFPPPKSIKCVQSISANQALKLLHQKTALLWRGDYHQGKQLLDAIKRRVHHAAKTPTDFHTHRMQTMQQNRLFHHILLEIDCHRKLLNARSPDIQAALNSAITTLPNDRICISFPTLLGMIGAYEWYKKGVSIPALNNRKIHVPYGVFSPLRGEYLQLITQAPLPHQAKTAWDIGTGSGVIAAILAQRGLTTIIATDNNPKAITAATHNLAQLGYQNQVQLIQTDLCPTGKADIIVFNPPWLPIKPTSHIETALYDHHHQTLQRFLTDVTKHLNPQGEVWLIMSNLAEHLGLRSQTQLTEWFQAAGLRVIQQLTTQPSHPKIYKQSDPLHQARQQEITSLWRLAITDC